MAGAARVEVSAPDDESLRVDRPEAAVRVDLGEPWIRASEAPDVPEDE
jgi:hypothetical protein